ncbi:imidazoleglycerol-phosphate dehydratase [Clostridia bacterium]|nr:imidazoleglycerol-phosphate dehydratase [Clostridia bacterium]
MERKAAIHRQTKETDIYVSLNLDGKGSGEIDTGIGFFDHMLTHIAKHSFIDLEVTAKGDLRVDAHHTVEDIGIALGKAVKQALGNKEGITRYGSAILPMDETLVLAAIDISGRAYLGFDAAFTSPKLGDFDTELTEEFFRAFSDNLGANLHIKLLCGKNNHHIAEGIFKAVARALSAAVALDPRVSGVLSTKGAL